MELDIVYLLMKDITNENTFNQFNQFMSQMHIISIWDAYVLIYFDKILIQFSKS